MSTQAKKRVRAAARRGVLVLLAAIFAIVGGTLYVPNVAYDALGDIIEVTRDLSADDPGGSDPKDDPPPFPCRPPAQPGYPRPWEASIPVSTYGVANAINRNLLTVIPIVEWSGVGPDLSFTLYHNSATVDSEYDLGTGLDFDLGPGWSTSYSAQVIDLDDSEYLVVGDDGTQDIHDCSSWPCVAPPGVHDILTVWAGGRYVTHKDRSAHMFDGDGNLTHFYDAQGNHISIDRQPANDKTVITDASGRTLELNYSDDTPPQLESIVAPAIDVDGTLQDIAERTWTMVYNVDDRLGRIEEEDYYVAGAFYTEIEYDDDGRISELSDKHGGSSGSGDTYTFTYVVDTEPDPDVYYNELLTVTDPEPGELTQSFDTTCPGSALIATEYTDRRGKEWVYEAVRHDVPENGELYQIENPLGQGPMFDFDTDFNLVTYWDARGKRWDYTYDTDGNLTQATDPLDNDEYWEYNDDNDLTQYTDALENEYNYYYDTEYPGLLTRIVEPADGQGNPAATTTLEYYLDWLDSEELTVVGDYIFFRADDGQHGVELWVTDGTVDGTMMVKDINESGDSDPEELTAVGSGQNALVFFRADNGEEEGVELWKSDGTVAGTVMVADIKDSGDSNPAELCAVDGTLFFRAFDGDDVGDHGTELWKCASPYESAVLVEDICPNACDSNPTDLVNLNGTLVFAAEEPGDGRELWKSESPYTDAELIRDIYQNGSSAPEELTVVGNGYVYFSAYTAAKGRELWRSSGGYESTELVEDIKWETYSSNPTHLTAVVDTLMFQADDGGHGREPWKSNSSGTSIVEDIGDFGADGSSDPKEFTYVNGIVYFQADDDDGDNIELWKTESPYSSASKVAEINTSGSSTPHNLTTVDVDKLFFAADDGTHGVELWWINGENAPAIFKDIYPGEEDSNPEDLIYYSNGVISELFFRANDGVKGQTIWMTESYFTGIAAVDNEHRHGLLKKVTDANGVVTAFDYDQWGQQALYAEGQLDPLEDEYVYSTQQIYDGGSRPRSSATACQSGSCLNGGDITYSVLAATSKNMPRMCSTSRKCWECKGAGAKGDIPTGFPSLPASAPTPPVMAVNSDELSDALGHLIDSELTFLEGGDETDDYRDRTITYDELGRLTANNLETDESGDSVSRPFAFDYDDYASGQITRTGADGIDTYIELDDAGRIKYVRRGTAANPLLEAEYSYNQNGQVTQVKYGHEEELY
ncbi:MAG: hypothetical protein JSU63_00230, partial [Phycisphaerales bacterium]